MASDEALATMFEVRRELESLVALLEPKEREGGLDTPELATLNSSRLVLEKSRDLVRRTLSLLPWRTFGEDRPKPYTNVLVANVDPGEVAVFTAVDDHPLHRGVWFWMRLEDEILYRCRGTDVWCPLPDLPMGVPPGENPVWNTRRYRYGDRTPSENEFVVLQRKGWPPRSATYLHHGALGLWYLAMQGSFVMALPDDEWFYDTRTAEVAGAR